MILTFDNNQQRDAFLKLLRDARPGLAGKARATHTLPSLAFLSLSDEEQAWLEQNIGEFGKAHRDVQFSPMT